MPPPLSPDHPPRLRLPESLRDRLRLDQSALFPVLAGMVTLILSFAFVSLFWRLARGPLSRLQPEQEISVVSQAVHTIAPVVRPPTRTPAATMETFLPLAPAAANPNNPHPYPDSKQGNPEGPILPTPFPTLTPRFTPDPGWAEITLANMSLEQMVGQLIITGIYGAEPNETDCWQVKQLNAGGITFLSYNVRTPEQMQSLTAALQRCAQETGAPPLFLALAHEGEYINRFHSGVTTFPNALMFGALDDPNQTRLSAALSGGELAYSGVNMVLAPGADILLNLDNRVVSQRSYGGDPQRVALQVAAAVEGYSQAGVVPVLSHFPGYGGSDSDPSGGSLVDQASRETLENIYLPPFRAGIEAGAPVVRLGNIAFPAVTGDRIPADYSKFQIRRARELVGGQGLVISDDIEIAGLHHPQGPAAAARQAVKIGVDLLLVNDPAAAEQIFHHLWWAAKEDPDLEERVIESARRVLQAKASWGITSHEPQPVSAPDLEANYVLAWRQAYAAVTRVRDRAGLVPVPPGPLRVLLIGPDENWAYTAMLAEALSGQGNQVTQAYYAPPWEGRVNQPELLDSLPAQSRENDLVIVLTWQAYLNQIELEDRFQGELVKRLQANKTPLITVGLRSPTDLLAYPDVGTYLATFGTMDGSLQGLTDVLTGASPPLGTNPLPDLH